MAYETKDFTGALFRNKDKQTENHPDSNGRVKIAGVEYYMSGWTKLTKDGDKYVSLSFKPVVQKAAAKPRPNSNPALDDPESVPF